MWMNYCWGCFFRLYIMGYGSMDAYSSAVKLSWDRCDCHLWWITATYRSYNLNICRVWILITWSLNISRWTEPLKWGEGHTVLMVASMVWYSVNCIIMLVNLYLTKSRWLCRRRIWVPVTKLAFKIYLTLCCVVFIRAQPTD